MAIATKHQEVEGNMLCGNGCQACPSMKTGAKFERNGEEWTVKYENGNPSTCDTRFVVYLIRCLVCSGHSKEGYVGSTERCVGLLTVCQVCVRYLVSQFAPSYCVALNLFGDGIKAESE